MRENTLKKMGTSLADVVQYSLEIMEKSIDE